MPEARSVAELDIDESTDDEVRWTVSLDNATNPRFPNPTWTDVLRDHFDEAALRINDVVTHFNRAFDGRFVLPEAMWNAARAHRRWLGAGLPLPNVE
jgi:hypothetical protein